MIAAWSLQQAVYARLTTALTGTAQVYDHVPQSEDGDRTPKSYPYVVIGDGSDREFDCDDATGTDSEVQIDIWSRYRGRKEVKQLMGSIHTALHRQSLSVEGADFGFMTWEFSDDFLEPDGLTRHGVMRFRVVLDHN